MTILRVAVPSPLRRSFDYLPPSDGPAQPLQAGMRVEVPFGRRTVVALILELAEHSDFPADKLKPAVRVIDSEPTLQPELLELTLWASRYYQHPVGDVISNALPSLLRQGEPLASSVTHWQLTVEGLGIPEGGLSRAPKQAAALTHLRDGSKSIAELKSLGIERPILKNLKDKGLAEEILVEAEVSPPPVSLETSRAPQLNEEQQTVVEAIRAHRDRFHVHLLEGVTGSGKTEVYLRLIEECLNREKQALILVPEIGLTPQLLQRFQQRLAQPVVAMHSGLNDTERLNSWRQARNGLPSVIVGTRSAIFAPLANPGLIIIDEEHDPSLKQQEGFRYSARDLAVKRAADLNIPIVMGSATPSLESLSNAHCGRYQHHRLTQRAGGAKPPLFDTVDIRHAPMQDGFSPLLLESIEQELKQGNQVLAFINRRGFAPTLICHDCGWIGECRHCDARMTVHLKENRLRCHHCDHRQPLPRQCPSCNSPSLDFRGPGTERCERMLSQRFPDTPVIRIDRDTTQRKHALRDALDEVKEGKPCILVGTQMLAKGHHLPDVTLVAVIDIDSGLFSADFRGPERMAQLLMQVAGRAGREAKRGRVMIQTHHPEHEILTTLLEQGYGPFAKTLLQERQQLGMPPYQHLAMVRADAGNIELPERFLRDLRRQIEPNSNCGLLGPLPAPMTRRAGRFRAQLLLRSDNRKTLHHALALLCHAAEQHRDSNKLRWSVDVDPVEMF